MAVADIVCLGYHFTWKFEWVLNDLQCCFLVGKIARGQMRKERGERQQVKHGSQHKELGLYCYESHQPF